MSRLLSDPEQRRKKKRNTSNYNTEGNDRSPTVLEGS
jgi:hypothetical protein